ncbi:MAG: MFS transporter [bacterium]
MISQGTLQRTFAALQHPNYRLWFIGQTVSLFGSWMQSTAQGFLVYQLTHSSAYLGYVAFASGLPIWLFMLFAGVVADRMPRRTLLMITQTGMMILAFLLTALTFSGLVQPWHIVVLAFFLGLANAFDAPARLAFVMELVNRDDLTNAIALNATMFNLATAVGPAVAGLTYAAFGPGWCFLLNGISFLAVIGALLRMRLKSFVPQERKSSALFDLREGLRFVFSQSAVRTIMLFVAVFSLFGISFITLFPAWAVKVLGGNATTNGLLQSARGLGALISALTLASMSRTLFKGRSFTIGTFAFPLCLLLFSFMVWLPLSLLALVALGAAQILIMNLANNFLQTLSPDALRGRVMSVFSLLFFGFMPIGGLLTGGLADQIGEPLTVMAGGSIVLLMAALVYLFQPRIRSLR